MSLFIPSFTYKATLRLRCDDDDTARAVIDAIARLPGVRSCRLTRASAALRQLHNLHIVMTGYQPPKKEDFTARISALPHVQHVWPQAYFNARYRAADTPAPELP